MKNILIKSACLYTFSPDHKELSMKRFCLIAAMLVFSIGLVFAETDSFSGFRTISFGNTVEARLVEGALQWVYPALGNSEEGFGHIDWRSVAIREVTLIKQVKLPGGENGVGVACTSLAGDQVIYLFREVWGGLELLDSASWLSVPMGERIAGFDCTYDSEESLHVSWVWTSGRLLTRTISSWSDIRDEVMLPVNSKAFFQVQKARDASTVTRYFPGAFLTESGWVSFLSSLKDGRLSVFSQHEPLVGGIEPGSLVYNRTGTQHDALLFTGTAALLWSWSNATPWAGSRIELARNPTWYYWKAQGQKAVFINKNDSGFLGSVTASAGTVKPIEWQLSISGTVSFIGDIRPTDTGFRLWCAMLQDKKIAVYSLEISGNGGAHQVLYGTLETVRGDVHIKWQDGKWILTAGPETGSWELNESEQKMIPVQDASRPVLFSGNEGY